MCCVNIYNIPGKLSGNADKRESVVWFAVLALPVKIKALLFLSAELGFSWLTFWLVKTSNCRVLHKSSDLVGGSKGIRVAHRLKVGYSQAKPFPQNSFEVPY
jgi:hypothetical protein